MIRSDGLRWYLFGMVEECQDSFGFWLFLGLGNRNMLKINSKKVMTHNHPMIKIYHMQA